MSRRFLLAFNLLRIIFLGLAVQPVQAKLGPISIRSVYTTEQSDKPKVVFMTGDRINYHVDVDNTTGATSY